MKIAVFGTGIVGQTFAVKFVELGHEVRMGTRDVDQTLSRSTPDRYGNPPLRDWLQGHPQVQLCTYADAAAPAELVLNATSGTGSLEALGLAGAENLNGKVLIDVANPLDFSRGMPPSLTVVNTDSPGEQIQRAYPEVKVVKTLNTMNCALMVNPQQLAGGDHHVFVSGNDPQAKGQVIEILKSWLGWKRVIDLGDITTARGAEMILPVWVMLMGVVQTPLFNFKIVTPDT